MPLYKEITTGWPDNVNSATTRTEVKHLVNTNQWVTLGIWFNFTPVYHAGFNHFIDWRCVPESLMLVLSGKPRAITVPSNRPHHPKSCKQKSPRSPKPYAIHRRELYDLQGGVCHYCKLRVAHHCDWSIDHRLPYARGGTNVAQNRIGCCKPCNNRKGPLTEEEFFVLKPGEPGIDDRCRNAIKRNGFHLRTEK